jgi:hypothetical protein
MSSNIHMTKLAAVLLAAVAQGAVLSGCTKGVSEVTGFATTPQEAKPFVQEARPTTTEYIPVGSSTVRTAARKPVSEFKTIEASWKPSASPTRPPERRPSSSARRRRRPPPSFHRLWFLGRGVALR